MAKALVLLTLLLPALRSASLGREGGACQDPPVPKVTATPSEPTDKLWVVTGTADYPNEVLLLVAARRFERRWEDASSRFREIPSDQMRTYATGTVKRKEYEARIPAAPIGMYRLTVSPKHEDLLLFETRICLGRVDRLFATSRERLRKIVETVEKAEGFLKEIISFHAKEKIPSPKLRDEYLNRINKFEGGLEDLLDDTDLTGTVTTLRSIYFHLRNAQVWHMAGGPPQNGGGIYEDKGIFLSPDVTLGTIKKQLESIRKEMSLEIRLSIATLAEDLYARAKGDAKRIARIREVLKEASKLASEAPEKDEAFAKILEDAQSARDNDQATAARAAFQGVIDTLMSK